MLHSTSLVTTIVVSFVLAFALGYGARLLRLPPLVGYLLAGVVLRVFAPDFFAANNELASQLAEIGVILLMFGIGLHFSVRDLMSVWSIAVPGALIQMAFSLGAGVGLAWLWGWSISAGLILGLALSVASTIVVMRILEDRGLIDSLESQISMGWLIAQDLVMILALVLLTSVAGAGAGDMVGALSAVALTLGKLGLFIALVLIVGQRALPWLLSRVAKTGSRELFTLSVLAGALGLAFGSSMLFGVSLALGAFFAGVVLSESDFSYQAASDSLPLQDAFAVLFFVSVGMLFDPAIILEKPWHVAAIMVVILLVKSVPAFLLLLLSGRSLHSSLTVTACLAQVGEFSFILANIAVGLGLFPTEGRDLVLAGALLSITINPLLISRSGNVSFWLVSRPRFQRWKNSRSSTPPPPELPPHITRKHAIVVGHGHVGSLIAAAFERHGVPYVIVERDRRIVDRLRKQGRDVIWGDAAAPHILDAAGIKYANMLILAAPHSPHSRHILEEVKESNGHVEVIARARYITDLSEMERLGVSMAAMGERELAFSMMAFALKKQGLSVEDIAALIDELRRVDR